MWKSETLIQVKEILLTVSTMFINAIKIKILIQILLHVAVYKCIHDKHSRKGTCSSLFFTLYNKLFHHKIIVLKWIRINDNHISDLVTFLKQTKAGVEAKPTIVDIVIMARYHVSVKLISLMEEINKVTQSKSGQPAQSKHSTAAEKPW